MGGGRIPSAEYEVLNYIEGRGNTYMPLYAKADKYTLVKLAVTYPQRWGVLFGQSYVLLNFDLINYPYVIYCYGGAGGNQLKQQIASWSGFAEVECKLFPNEQYFKLNNVVLGQTSFPSDAYTPQVNGAYACLFGRDSDTNYHNPIYCRVSYFQMYSGSQNAQLIRDLIPVRRKSDGRVGMWCFVSKTFYTDANGYFIGG